MQLFPRFSALHGASLGVWLGIALVACSGDDPAAQQPSTNADEACTTLARALCTRFVSCANADFVDDDYDCVKIARSQCATVVESEHVTAGAADIDACRSRVENLSCNQAFGGGLDCDFPAGTLADGAACKEDVECASSSCLKGFADCGTCGVAPGEGQDCVKFECARGLRCASDGKCRAERTAGESCQQPTQPCASGFDCVAGVCTEPASLVGAACDPDDDDGLSAPRCNLLQGLYCGEETRKCLALTVAQPGEVCGLVDASAIACTVSYQCVLDEDSSRGICMRRAAVGQPCGDDSPGRRECDLGLSCRDSVCVDPSSVSCR